MASIDASPIGDLIDRIAATPMRLRRAIAGRSTEELTTRSTSGTWSAQEVIAHLRASDDIVAPRLLMVLTRDNIPLASIDERRWAEIAGYASKDPWAAVEAFALRRSEMVAALRRASRSDWERAGQHEVRGRMTLLDIAHTIASHEDEHCRQLEALKGRGQPEAEYASQ